MKHCCVDDPADLCSVNISGQAFTDVKEEDFALFDNVAYVNAAENFLPLGSFFIYFLICFVAALFTCFGEKHNCLKTKRKLKYLFLTMHMFIMYVPSYLMYKLMFVCSTSRGFQFLSHYPRIGNAVEWFDGNCVKTWRIHEFRGKVFYNLLDPVFRAKSKCPISYLSPTKTLVIILVGDISPNVQYILHTRVTCTHEDTLNVPAPGSIL